MTVVPPFSIACHRPFLIVTFGVLQRMLSWSMTKPGFQVARRVAWLEVRNEDLSPQVDAAAFLSHRMEEASLGDAIALMTSRDVRRSHHAHAAIENVTASCVTTVGLSNAERIGHRIGAAAAAGTINTLVHVSCPLLGAALIEAIAITAQARTAAVIDSGFRRAGIFITGTGTDCIVIAAPHESNGHRFVGLHTAIGEAIGACVYEATATGIASWLADNGCA